MPGNCSFESLSLSVLYYSSARVSDIINTFSYILLDDQATISAQFQLQNQLIRQMQIQTRITFPSIKSLSEFSGAATRRARVGTVQTRNFLISTINRIVSYFQSYYEQHLSVHSIPQSIFFFDRRRKSDRFIKLTEQLMSFFDKRNSFPKFELLILSRTSFYLVNIVLKFLAIVLSEDMRRVAHRGSVFRTILNWRQFLVICSSRKILVTYLIETAKMIASCF